MGRCLLAVVAVLLLPRTSMAAQHEVIVIGTYQDRTQAGLAARLASARMSYPLADETLQRPPSGPLFAGKVVALSQTVGGYDVVIFVGDKDEAAFAMANASPFFPDAEVRTVDIEKPDGRYLSYTPKSLVVVGVREKYDEALRLAKFASEKSGLIHVSRGLVMDEKRGLIWPDDDPDALQAGSYRARHDNACNEFIDDCISVERSDFYQGFMPGYFVVLAGIHDDGREAATKAERLRGALPESYVARSVIYRGCAVPERPRALQAKTR